MPKPDDVGVGTALILMNRNTGEVLLGKRKGAHAAGFWALPGGWLDRGDCNMSNAVLRELEEETGLVADFNDYTPEFFRATTEDHEKFRTVTIIHSLLVGESLPPVLMEPDKCEQWGWFQHWNLPQPVFPNLAQAIKDFAFQQKVFDPNRIRQAMLLESVAADSTTTQLLVRALELKQYTNGDGSVLETISDLEEALKLIRRASRRIEGKSV